jgi:hypothetical protein
MNELNRLAMFAQSNLSPDQQVNYLNQQQSQQPNMLHSAGSGIGDFLHRNFVDGTVPLSSDENEWAQEIMGSRRLAKQERLRAAEQFGKSAGKTVSGWFDYLPQEQARKGMRHLLEKYGTGGPIEPVTQPTQQQDDGVMGILKRYDLAE